MRKKELKETDRKVIETFIKMDWSYGQIAKVLDVNKSTVSREIKNRGLRMDILPILLKLIIRVKRKDEAKFQKDNSF